MDQKTQLWITVDHHWNPKNIQITRTNYFLQKQHYKLSGWRRTLLDQLHCVRCWVFSYCFMDLQSLFCTLSHLFSASGWDRNLQLDSHWVLFSSIPAAPHRPSPSWSAQSTPAPSLLPQPQDQSGPLLVWNHSSANFVNIWLQIPIFWLHCVHAFPRIRRYPDMLRLHSLLLPFWTLNLVFMAEDPAHKPSEAPLPQPAVKFRRDHKPLGQSIRHIWQNKQMFMIRLPCLMLRYVNIIFWWSSIKMIFSTLFMLSSSIRSYIVSNRRECSFRYTKKKKIKQKVSER